MVERRLLQIASVILIVLGAGHLALSGILTRETLARWVSEGMWAAVPLLDSFSGPGAAQNSAAFWGGLGSFAVPLATLGMLVWYLASRGVRVPGFVGWIVGVWCLVGAVILVPSPFILGTVAGALIVVAGRRVKRQT